MKKKYFLILSFLIVGCIVWSIGVMAATSDPIVSEAQKRLTELGYDPGPADGKMGKKTEDAIRNFQRAQSLTITGKLDEETLRKLGVTKIEEQPAADGKEIEALFQQAVKYQDAGDYEKAIEAYTKVIERDSTDVEAYWKRGLLYNQKGRRDFAISDFRKVNVLKPDFANAYGLLGWSLILQGKFEEAKEPCRKAYDLDPKNFFWPVVLGHTYFLTGDRGTARKYYEQTLPLLKSEKDLKDVTNLFNVFIKMGWQTDACRQESAWMEQEFKTLEKRRIETLYQQAVESHNRSTGISGITQGKCETALNSFRSWRYFLRNFYLKRIAPAEKLDQPVDKIIEEYYLDFINQII